MQTPTRDAGARRRCVIISLQYLCIARVALCCVKHQQCCRGTARLMLLRARTIFHFNAARTNLCKWNGIACGGVHALLACVCHGKNTRKKHNTHTLYALPAMFTQTKRRRRSPQRSTLNTEVHILACLCASTRSQPPASGYKRGRIFNAHLCAVLYRAPNTTLYTRSKIPPPLPPPSASRSRYTHAGDDVLSSRA